MGACGQQAVAEWKFAVVCPACRNISKTCDASETCAHIRSSFLGLRTDNAADSVWQLLRKGGGWRKIGMLVALLRGASGSSCGGLRMLERVKISPGKLTPEEQGIKQRRGGEVFWRPACLMRDARRRGARWDGWFTCRDAESRSASTRIAAHPPTIPQAPAKPGRRRVRPAQSSATDHGPVKRPSTIR